MFKNKWFYGLLGLASASIVMVGTVGAAFAQQPDPPAVGAQSYGSPVSDAVDCEMSGWQGGAASGMRGQGGLLWGGMQGYSLVDATASATGLSTEDVLAELEAGKTFAEIAQAQGVSSEAIVDEFVAERAAALEQAVNDGRITQEQADAMIEEMTEHVTEHMTEPWSPESGQGAGPRGESGHGIRLNDGSGNGERGGRGMMGARGAGMGLELRDSR